MKMIYVLGGLTLVCISLIIVGAVSSDMFIKNFVAGLVPMPMAVAILGIVLELFVFKTYKKSVKE